MQADYIDEMNYASRLVVAAYHDTATNSEEMQIQKKGTRDIVTSIDYGIENYLIADIQRNFPDDQIIAEETYNKTLTNKRTWVIDPIDGTVNFARGFPFFGVQMALLVDK
ncbi:MAG: inositol monophosphatase family protein, partial [Chloroflexota bacterium]